MSDKLNETLTFQKDQLLKFLTEKDQAESTIKTLNEAIPQLRGSIQALEYVKTLGLQEPPKDTDKSPS